MRHNRKTAKGFTVLLAALISSLLLAVGLAIFDITFKQVLFAIVVKNSDYALYAADAGVECAEYWDRKYKGTGYFGDGTTFHSAFATSSDTKLASTQPTGLTCHGIDISQPVKIITSTDQPSYGEAHCNGTANKWCVYDDQPSSAVTAFKIDPLTPTSYCAIVEVSKTYSDGNINTLITSRGYNTCDTSNPDRVERSLQRTYTN